MASDLSAAVQALTDQHRAHMDAVAQVDATIDQINAIIGSSVGRPTDGGQRRSTPLQVRATRATPRQQGRSEYKMTAEELVLAFVKQSKNPTSRDVNVHWKSQGRPWTADVTLGKLVKAKKLKRTPLVGQRGSRYSVK